MTYSEIYSIYKSTNLNNYTFNCLASSNKSIQAGAMDKIKKANLQNKNDVLLFIAMNI